MHPNMETLPLTFQDLLDFHPFHNKAWCSHLDLWAEAFICEISDSEDFLEEKANDSNISFN